MEPKKAVLMDLWGVVVRPGLRAMFQQFEELHRLPGGFVWNAAQITIEDCGHWTQMEKPAEVNRILITWLQETHRKLPVTMAPKL
ncbi:unnamed protein product [Boreogadus saida]